MIKLLRYALMAALTLWVPAVSHGEQAAQTTSAHASHTNSNTEATAAPSAQEITDAKAKGLVWVNTKTHVYHKDGSFYGTTKHGKFMTEEDAQKAGYRAAKTSGSKKATAATATSK